MQFSGIFFALGAAVTWGLLYAIQQHLLGKVSPLTLLTLETILMAVLISPVVVVKYSSIRTIFVSDMTTFFAICLVVGLTVLANFFILTAINQLNASVASLFEIIYPLFVVLFSFLLFGQTISFFTLLGGGLMLMGAYIVVRFGHV